MLNKLEKNALIAWIICIIAITIFSLLPQITVPEKYHLDKFIHASSYAALAFLAYFFSSNRRNLLLILMLLIIMGGAIEIVQTFMPPRCGTIGDFAADFIGVILGAFIAAKIKFVILKKGKIKS